MSDLHTNATKIGTHGYCEEHDYHYYIGLLDAMPWKEDCIKCRNE